MIILFQSIGREKCREIRSLVFMMIDSDPEPDHGTKFWDAPEHIRTRLMYLLI